MKKSDKYAQLHLFAFCLLYLLLFVALFCFMKLFWLLVSMAGVPDTTNNCQGFQTTKPGQPFFLWPWKACGICKKDIQVVVSSCCSFTLCHCQTDPMNTPGKNPGVCSRGHKLLEFHRQQQKALQRKQQFGGRLQLMAPLRA